MSGDIWKRAFAAWILSVGGAMAAEPPLQPFSYREGFEGPSPKVELWAKSGPSTVNSIGPSEEQACEGKRSLKFDLTLPSGGYQYWGVRVRVPCAGTLKLSARILVAEGTTASVGFGTNVVYPPTHHSGCGPVETYRGPTREWKRVEYDLVARGALGAAKVMAGHAPTVHGDEVGAVLDRWALFISGRAGARAVVYLDDIRIEGQVPSQKDFQAELDRRWARCRERFGREIDVWRSELAGHENAVRELSGLAGVVQEYAESAYSAADTARKLADQLAKRGYASSAEMETLQAASRTLAYAPDTIRALIRGQAAGHPYLIYTPRAITNDRFSGEAFPIPWPIGKELVCSGCRGEYEPVSVAVCALQDIRGLTVSASDLKGPAGMIPADAVDVRVVKCWYQAGRTISITKQRLYVPELLLKDDALMRVDRQKEENFLRSTATDGTHTYVPCSGPTSEELQDVRPVDAARLQPVDIPARSLQQFWITVHIPENAQAGTYQGVVEFRTGQVGQQIPLKLTVHPFDLAPPRLIYSIYYRGRLAPDGQPAISANHKSEEQYRAEMADLKAHGVLYPTSYQGMDAKLLTRTLEIRKEAGLPGGPFYNLGRSTGVATSPRDLENLQREIKRWLAFCKPFGYDTVYFYGTDEARGERLRAQQAAWKAVQQAGGRTFVACYVGETFEAMGGLLNCAVLAGKPNPDEAHKWHGVGSHVFCYAYPQVGHEEPETYRRHFGLELWQAGFDGAMDYAYQHQDGHVWNDFDGRKYRDHVFSYPTLNGVVNTTAWEGFREGVDDVRYLTTLLDLLEREKSSPAKRQLAAEAQQWIDALDATGDLDALRAKMVEWIVRLSVR